MALGDAGLGDSRPVLWLLASFLFSLYVSNFASYDATYGSLGAVAVLLLWFYISAFVVMLGAELNAELELQTRARHDGRAGAADGPARRLRCRPRRRDRAELSPASHRLLALRRAVL